MRLDYAEFMWTEEGTGRCKCRVTGGRDTGPRYPFQLRKGVRWRELAAFLLLAQEAATETTGMPGQLVALGLPRQLARHADNIWRSNPNWLRDLLWPGESPYIADRQVHELYVEIRNSGTTEPDICFKRGSLLISATLDGSQIQNIRGLADLLVVDGAGAYPQHQLLEEFAFPHSYEDLIELYKSAMTVEIKKALRETCFYDFGWIREHAPLPDLLKREPFDLQLGLPGPRERSMMAALGEASVSVAIPADLVGALCILSYLNNSKAVGIHPDYRFSHSPQIAHHIIKGEEPHYEACVVSLATADTISKHNYVALCIMPEISRRIIAPRALGKHRFAENLNYGDYRLLYDAPSTSGDYLRALEHRGLVSRANISVVESEPQDSTRSLKEGNPDMRAIMTFPYYLVHRQYNTCILLDQVDSPLTRIPTVMLLHRKYNEKLGDFLKLAIRDAWLDLQEYEVKILDTMSNLLADGKYLKYLNRFGGIHYLLR